MSVTMVPDLRSPKGNHKIKMRKGLGSLYMVLNVGIWEMVESCKKYLVFKYFVFEHTSWRLFYRVQLIWQERRFYYIQVMWILIDWFIVFNATFSNISAISWRPVLVVEEAGVSGQAMGKLYYLRLRVECTIFCNLQSRARTHAVLVIGLYELLGNPTT